MLKKDVDVVKWYEWVVGTVTISIIIGLVNPAIAMAVFTLGFLITPDVID